MKNILIDHPAKIISVIILYLILLGVWWVNYMIGLLQLFDGPRTPTLESFMGWWLLNPIAVILGIITGILTYLAKQKSVATIFFYSPVVAAILLVIPLFVTELQTRHANQVWFDDYWGDPPREIDDLDLSEVGFSDVSHDPDFENIYLLPEDVSASDIIYWDGAVLVFETEKSFVNHF